MKSKKHLSFTSLRKFVSSNIRTWQDSRREKSTMYSVHDAMMSGFACMFFQEPSLLQFQKHLQKTLHQNNLCTLFGVQDIPKTKALKETVDAQDSKGFNTLFKGIVHRLDRGKQLEQFKLYNNLTICSIDGTEYHGSESVHCKQCLTKNKDNPDKTTRYQHFALQAAFMHPDIKQVIPVMAEPVRNTDGAQKQDCELNAAKRLIPSLRQQFPRKKLIITGDDLFSHQPMIELVLNNHFNFFFVVKPTSHKYMMEWLDTYEQLPEYREVDASGRTILYQWMNDVPLHGEANAVRVNYLCKKILAIDPNGKERVCKTESWVTDMAITQDNVVLFSRGAKSRWKIENECFNTLKKQGYNLEHNYGHGEKNLAFNFYLLTLLAFLFHQVFELSDAAFQASRVEAGSKISLWEKLRTFINFFIFKTWEQLLAFLLDGDGYNIIDGHVVVRVVEQPPP